MNREIESFRVDVIECPAGRRPLDDKAVARLAESIRKVGLRTPLSVRVVDNYVVPSGETVNGVPVLVTGAHRLAAARRLNLERVECFVLDGETEAQARLWEIAENLHRAELTELERDTQLAERIRLTEQEAEGRTKKKVRQSDALSPRLGRGKKSGVRQASRELGVSEPDARRAIKVDSLTPEAKEAARDVGLDDNRSALLRAAEVAPEHQAQAIRDIAAKKQEAKERPKSAPPVGAPASLAVLISDAATVLNDGPEQQERDLLVYAWEAASEATRQWFRARYFVSTAAA